MVAIRTGNATPEKQGRLTGTLTVGDPRFESLVQGLGIEAHLIHEIRLFAKRLATDAGRFQVRRRAGLFGHRKRISKVAAESLWHNAFGSPEREGAR